MCDRQYVTGFDGLSIRGDSTSCPLAFGLDTYYNCPFDCAYCSYLALPATWGGDKPWRALNVDAFKRRMAVNIYNERPRSALAYAISQRKTLRVGNRYDPLPPVERDLKITLQVLEFLKRLNWEIKLESKNAELMYEYSDLLISMKAIVTTTVLIGMEDDWIRLEGDVPSCPMARLSLLQYLAGAGLQVAVLTEPFIPGYHTVEQFRDFCRLAKSMGITRLNVYNLKLNPFNAKRLLAEGLDVERIFDLSCDDAWRPVLAQLLEIGQETGVKVGCPDWVNAGRAIPTTNTCCGVDVAQPCAFNFINWRRIGLETGEIALSDLADSWDGVCAMSFDRAIQLFWGELDNHYGLADTGIFTRSGDGWTLD